MRHRLLFAATIFVLAGSISSRGAEPSTKPDKDAFLSKTTWKGLEHNASRENAPKRPASVKVIKRNGNKVVFNFWCAADKGRKGVQLEGTIDAGQIKAKVTKVLPGDDWHETMAGAFFSGTVNDKSLTLIRKSHRGGTMTSELTLQKHDNGD